MSGYFSGFFVGIFAIVILLIWVVIHLWYVIIPLITLVIIWYLFSHKTETKMEEIRLDESEKPEQTQEEQENLRRLNEAEILEIREFMLFAKMWKNRMENQDKFFKN